MDVIKTGMDVQIHHFAVHIAEEEFDHSKFEKLLTSVREYFGLDAVSIIEKAGVGNRYACKFESTSSPEYDLMGGRLMLSEEEYEMIKQIYTESPLQEGVVDSVKQFGFAENTLHYGFIREQADSYDGSIAFQCFSPHEWTDEEKAVLVKLGRLYKMILSVELAEGVYEPIHKKLERERKRYRDALTEGTMYSYSMDITDGMIREKIMLADGSELLESIGFKLPVNYNELNKVFLEKNNINMDGDPMVAMLTSEGLIGLFRSGETHPEMEYYNPRSDRYIRITVFMYEDKETGHVCGLFAASDITAARRKQEAEKKALRDAYDAANQANATKTRFLSNMSHDIRTPMNGIIGMTAIAATHIDDKQRVSDCLSKISVASKHLLGLINDILDMSKIESGKLELQNEEFTLPQLLDELISVANPGINAKRHHLHVAIKDIKHENVVGDRRRLEQAFMNLLSNAIKYTPDGGKISITLSEKPVKKHSVGCYEFIFEDNGIGMDEEYLEHLFEPFTRADDKRVSGIQGTGLGMSITKNIVQMMNGSIKVESEPNKGTKFIVTVFLQLQRDEDFSYERFVDLPILVADDDETACETTCAILDELGMKGEYVLTGAEALERVETRHAAEDDYFAVILDWIMPGMDGVETARRIRKTVGDEVPIIILSAYDWSDIEHIAREAGVNGFLSKPLFKSKVAYLFKEIMLGEKPDEADETLSGIQNVDFSGKKALLVEDNELNAEIATEILKMAKLDVELAVDGKEALNMVREAPDNYYDIIFMDIQMPVMDGYESAKAIRALPRAYTKQLPILAMTANAFAEDAVRAKNAGMNEHIPKPIDFSRLTEALRKWLG